MTKNKIAFDDEKTDAKHILRCVIYVQTYMSILSDLMDSSNINYKEFVKIKPICLKVCDYLKNELSKGLSKSRDNVFIAIQIMDLLIFYEMAKGFIEPTIDTDDEESKYIITKLGVDRPTLKKDLTLVDKKIDKLKALILRYDEKD